MLSSTSIPCQCYSQPDTAQDWLGLFRSLDPLPRCSRLLTLCHPYLCLITIPRPAEFWGLPGYRCDSRPSLTASGLCHRPLPYGVAPTLAGLFFMRWSNASAAGAAAADNA
jgi:hypothetical protein